MTGLTAELAERSAGLSVDDLSDDVTAMARLCILDWLGVTVVGSQEPAPQMLLRTRNRPKRRMHRLGVITLVRCRNWCCVNA